VSLLRVLHSIALCAASPGLSRGVQVAVHGHVRLLREGSRGGTVPCVTMGTSWVGS